MKRSQDTYDSNVLYSSVGGLHLHNEQYLTALAARYLLGHLMRHLPCAAQQVRVTVAGVGGVLEKGCRWRNTPRRPSWRRVTQGRGGPPAGGHRLRPRQYFRVVTAGIHRATG